MNIMNIIFLAIIVIIVLLCVKNKSGYVNYEKSHENPLLNCPEQYEQNILFKSKNLIIQIDWYK